MTTQALITKARNARLKALKSLDGPRSTRPADGKVVCFRSNRAARDTGFLKNIFADLGNMPTAA